MTGTKIFAGVMTAVTVATTFEVALIGTRALAEDVGFLSACGSMVKNGKKKKLKKALRKKH